MRRVMQWLIGILDAYNRCDVSQAAASLAYSLVLTLFPLLMCVSYILGLFHLDFAQFLHSFDEIFPQAVVEITDSYLRYASGIQSPAVFLAALAAIVTSASAGVRAMLRVMEKLYGHSASSGAGRMILSMLLSILFLLTIYVSLIVIFTGRWFFQAMETYLPPELAVIFPIQTISRLWKWLKYLLLFGLVLMLVLMIYRVGTPVGSRGMRMFFSTGLSAGAVVICSALFSWFIGLSSRYALLYGSLASGVIFLVWLYLCGNLLLVGALVCSGVPHTKLAQYGSRLLV